MTTKMSRNCIYACFIGAVFVLVFVGAGLCVYFLIETYEPNMCTVVDVDVMVDVKNNDHKTLQYFSLWTVDVADGGQGYLTEFVPKSYGQTLKMALRYSEEILPLNTTFTCYVNRENGVRREPSYYVGSIVFFSFAGICAITWSMLAYCYAVETKSPVTAVKRRKKRAQQQLPIFDDEYPTYV